MNLGFEEEKSSQIPRRNGDFYGEAENHELPAVGSSSPWHRRNSQELNPSPMSGNNSGSSAIETQAQILPGLEQWLLGKASLPQDYG